MSSIQQHHRWLQGLIIAAGVTALASGAWATTYSAVNDFSIASNPNGVWSYDYNGATLLPTAVGIPALGGWQYAAPGGGSANIFRNVTGTTVLLPGGSFDLATNELGIAAGPENSVNVIFTAPTAGLYSITGDFGDQSPATDYVDVAVSIAVGGASVFSGTIMGTAYGLADSFSLTEPLSLGETVDFIAAQPVGGECESCYDDAALVATITTGPSGVPEPASLALLVAGLFGLGALQRRRKATA